MIPSVIAFAAALIYFLLRWIMETIMGAPAEERELVDMAKMIEAMVKENDDLAKRIKANEEMIDIAKRIRDMAGEDNIPPREIERHKKQNNAI